MILGFDSVQKLTDLTDIAAFAASEADWRAINDAAQLGVHHQLAHTQDAVHRRADLMAHVGQELGLGAGEFGRPVPLEDQALLVLGPLRLHPLALAAGRFLDHLDYTGPAFDHLDAAVFDVARPPPGSVGSPALNALRLTPAGATVHDITVRVVIDDTLLVHDAVAVMRATPFAVCQGATRTLAEFTCPLSPLN